MISCARRKRWADGVEEIGTKEFDAVTTLVGKSFAGSRKAEPEWSVHWLLGPQLDDLDDPRRAETAKFFLSFAVAIHGHPHRGTVIGQRGEGGSLRSIMVVRRMPKAAPRIDRYWSDPTATLAVVGGGLARGTMPAVYTDATLRTTIAPPINKRVNLALLPGLEKMHKAHADCPHYYVAVAATLPEAQGRGHLSTLMRAVTRRADEEGLPCYLECSGTRNRSIYMRFGFREVGKYALEVEGDEPGSEPYTEEFAMWRPPQ
jgi:ribosomal protein S18 acetylase RimI-like enzyme